MCGSTCLPAVMGLGELVQGIIMKTYEHPCAFVSQTTTILISVPSVTLATHFPHIACGGTGEERM